MGEFLWPVEGRQLRQWKPVHPVGKQAGRHKSWRGSGSSRIPRVRSFLRFASQGLARVPRVQAIQARVPWRWTVDISMYAIYGCMSLQYVYSTIYINMYVCNACNACNKCNACNACNKCNACKKCNACNKCMYVCMYNIYIYTCYTRICAHIYIDIYIYHCISLYIIVYHTYTASVALCAWATPGGASEGRFLEIGNDG